MGCTCSVITVGANGPSERIIRYLQDQHGIDINAAFFSVYRVAGQETPPEGVFLIRRFIVVRIAVEKP